MSKFTFFKLPLGAEKYDFFVGTSKKIYEEIFFTKFVTILLLNEKLMFVII